MDERERRRDEDRILAVLLSGGPRAERLIEALDRAHEAEGEALQRLQRLTDQDPETLGEDDLAAMQSALDQGLAAEEERRTAIRKILEEEQERHAELEGGEVGSYG